MKIRLISFGELEIESERYGYDVVIEQGQVHKRKKSPSKPYRAQFGHTPLSALEDIPWSGGKLYIGTGTYGRLPVMDEVYGLAKERGVTVVARPTKEICGLLKDCTEKQVNAVLHVTC